MSKARQALAEAKRLEAAVSAGVNEQVVFRGARKIGGKYALVAVTWQCWGGAEGEYEDDGAGGGGSDAMADAEGTHKMRLAICFSGEGGAGPGAAAKEHDLVRRVPALDSSEQAKKVAAELVGALELCESTGALLLPS